MTDKNINWDASSFFETLASKNKLAKTEEFRFCRVSGLEDLKKLFSISNPQLTSLPSLIHHKDIQS